MSDRILVIGATGYVGGRLIPRLLESGYRVRCLVRTRSKLENKVWSSDVEVFEGDVLNRESLLPAFAGIDIVYYLVHSMGSTQRDFAELDRRAAANAGRAAQLSGVTRIIYLGGLGRRNEQQSIHLRSRHEVGDVLRESGVAVTEFRAAVVIGAGSLSFEMIHHLANRLPVMICPRWVITKTQPISVHDVIGYLVATIDTPESTGRIIDIGGPEVLTYRDMMLAVAKVLGLRRWLIKVPVLTPRLSSYWVGLVTPIPIKPARALIEGLRHETICENDDALRLFSIKPRSFEIAVRQALSAVTSYHEARPGKAGESIIRSIEPSHLLIDQRQVTVSATARQVSDVFCAVGGTNGWFYANWLWKLRGLIDRLFGGVGLRRGRQAGSEVTTGVAIDFWRVAEYEQGKRMLLQAEMKLPGVAWLEFAVDDIDRGRSTLTQTARFYPRGLLGIAYWYGVFPVHVLVFRGLVRAIAKRAERLALE